MLVSVLVSNFNVEGLRNVLGVALGLGVEHFIYTSTKSARQRSSSAAHLRILGSELTGEGTSPVRRFARAVEHAA